MIVIKFILITVLLYIFLQDFKDREVYWFLFPIVGILTGFLHFNEVLREVFLLTLIYNILFVLFIFMLTLLYIKLKLKEKFSHVFGYGDLLFFIAITFSFSTFSFIVLFVMSLIFSLSLHIILKNKSSHSSVPLAGYMSLFFLSTYLAYWMGIVDSLYRI
ncbi:hypothetical protein FT986_03590 [Mesonia sp. K4-1]|nr:hypothetical protein FT986_03590 [Mesonia sp. K4-1]